MSAIIITAVAIVVIIAIILLLAHRYLRAEDEWEDTLSKELDNRPWLDDTDRMATNTDILTLENERREWWRERGIAAQAAVIVSVAETDVLLERGTLADAWWTRKGQAA